MVIPLVSVEGVLVLSGLAGLRNTSKGVVVVAMHGNVLKVPVGVILKLPASQISQGSRASLSKDRLVEAFLVSELALDRIVVELLVDTEGLNRYEQVLV
jgi:hypothetical protein